MIQAPLCWLRRRHQARVCGHLEPLEARVLLSSDSACVQIGSHDIPAQAACTQAAAPGLAGAGVATGPSVIASSILDGDIVPALQPLTLSIRFDEPLEASGLDAADLRLIGAAQGVIAPLQLAYDPETSSLDVQYPGLTDGFYVFVLWSGDGAFEDPDGNDLDGEPDPVTTVPSGDGVPGGDFVLVFSTRLVTAPLPVPLTAVTPEGSLIHETGSAGTIDADGDLDHLTIPVDPDQALTVVVEPDGTLAPEVTLLDPAGAVIGAASAASPGEPVVVSPAWVSSAGVYSIVVRGADDTAGDYDLRLVLNSEVERETLGAAANDLPANARSIDGSAVPIGDGARSAVLGRLDAPGDTADWYAVSLDDADLVSLRLTSGADLSLELYDDLGVLQATGVRAADGSSLIRNFLDTTTDGASNEVLVRITGSAADDYSLVVTHNAVLDVEPNGDFDTADDLSLATTALGHAAADPAGGSGAFGTPLLSFAGQGFNGVQPPDTVGDIGPDHYIQMINAPEGTTFTIYNKGDGSLALGPIVLDTLAPPGSLGASGFGDPIVLYDHLADRWLLSEFTDRAVGNALNVYISQTSDPTDNLWHYYGFETPGFPDYPKFAVWPDAYYVSTNEGSPAVYAFDRTSMLQGLPARPSQRFTAPRLPGFDFQALTPSDLDGPAPPADAPNYFMRHRDDEAHAPGGNDPTRDFLEIWQFRADFETPANAGFTQIADVPVAEFESDLCGLVSFECVPQPGTSVTLDPLREVIMHRLQYRNFTRHETLVGNFTVDVDGTDRAGVRWFELRRSGGGPWTLFQEGTVAPDAHHRWMGAIAMDGAGNIILGYNVSSSTLSPGIRYTGRSTDDPLGTMPQGEHTLVSGSGFNDFNRWGDYSAMSIDPVDDLTAWFTGEYASGTRWRTHVGAFKLIEAPDEDWFRFAVNDGDVLALETLTLADGPLEFVNAPDPRIELIDPTGAAVASDDNSAPDGRNAALTYSALLTGAYRAVVTTENDTGGTYVLRIDGATGAQAPPTVVDTSPVDGTALPAFPAQIRIDFSEPILVSSIDAGDLVVGGLAALQVRRIDADTLEFDPDPSADTGDRNYTVSLAAGAVQDLKSNGVAPFTGSFTLDRKGPIVLDTFWNGEPYPAAGRFDSAPLSFEARFDDDLRVFARAGRGLRTPGAGDVLLENTTLGTTVPADAVSYDGLARTFQAEFPALEEGLYRLTLTSGDDAFEDDVGNDLDGEPRGANQDGTPTGDGTADGDYFVDFVVDRATVAAGTPFRRVEPLGSVVSISENTGVLDAGDDTDAFSFSVEEGQTLSVVATPTAPDVLLQVEVIGETATVIAPALGLPAVVGPVVATADGTWTVRVGGSDTTTFALDAWRNASLEAQAAGADTADGNELPIDASMISPIATARRYAVVGAAEPNGGVEIDEYLIDLTGRADRPIDVVVTGLDGADFGGAQVELLDPTGALVAANQPPAPGVDPAALNHDLVIAGAVAPGDGVHTVRFTSSQTGAYALVVTESLAFELEPNDTPDGVLRAIDRDLPALGHVGAGAGTPPGTIRDEPNDTIATAVDSGIGSASSIFTDAGTIGDNTALGLSGLDVDLIRVDLEAGDRITVDVDAQTNASPLDSVLRLFDASGSELVVVDDLPAPGEVFTFDPYIDFTVNAAGTYHVGVSGFDNFEYDPNVDGSGVPGSTGQYNIEIRIGAAPARALADEPNDTIATAVGSGLGAGGATYFDAGVIGDHLALADLGLDVDLVRVDLVAGDRVTIDVDAASLGSALDPMLRLFDAQGGQLAVSDDNPAPGEPFTTEPYIDFTASATGAYYVGISGFANVAYDPGIAGSGLIGSTGPYEIVISVIASPRDTDRYRIDALRNADVTVSALTPFGNPATSPVNDLAPRLVVTDPSGQPVATDDGSGIVSFAAPDTGSYIVEVSAASGAGEYALVANIADPPGPRVVAIHARRSTWTSDVLGTGRYAFPLGDLQQLRPLPYRGLDELAVVFDRTVVVDAADLAITGAVTGPVTASMTWDPAALTATWRFDRDLADVDGYRLTLGDAVVDLAGNALDGEWTDGVSTVSGDGVAGGAFTFAFNVLAGDTDGDFVVGTEDLAACLAGFTTIVPVGAASQCDLAGGSVGDPFTPDGIVGTNDLGAVLRQFTATLTAQASRAVDVLAEASRARMASWHGWRASGRPIPADRSAPWLDLVIEDEPQAGAAINPD
ncbi:MAG: hypothetical protein CMJ18_17110 [Phycisphaeraceae bacterium]|nr:hypothetical protein [Phycisphaeraceae bacterium]